MVEGKEENGRHVGTRTPDLYRVKVIDLCTARAGSLASEMCVEGSQGWEAIVSRIHLVRPSL